MTIESLGFAMTMIGFFMMFSSVLIPILVFFNVGGIREELFRGFSNVPGFGAGSRINAAVAAFSYLLGVGFVLFIIGALMWGGIAEPTIEDPSLSSEEIEPGESIVVNADIVNEEDEIETFDVELVVNGDTVQSVELELEPGEREQVTFEETFAEAGDFQIEINDDTVGQLQVVEPPPAEFEIRSNSLNTNDLYLDERLTVEISVENVGEVEGEETLTFAIDDSAKDAQEVSLDPGESRTVDFTWEADEVGEFEVGINDENVGVITVTPHPEDDQYFTDIVVHSVEESGYDVENVQIADGRDEGGEKAIVLSYRSDATSEADLGEEMGTMAGAFAGAVEAGWDIDSMIVIMGDQDGNAIGTYHIEEQWVQEYLDDEITMETLAIRILSTLV